MFDAERFSLLTAREREIAAAALAGRSSAAIATELSLSRRTVENHLANIYRKLRIGNRRELGRLAALGDAASLDEPASLGEVAAIGERAD